MFWDLFVLSFFFPAVLSVFLASCSILELEAAISTVLQHFGVRTSHSQRYFGAKTFHAGRYFASRIHLRFVYVCLRVFFQIGLGLV